MNVAVEASEFLELAQLTGVLGYKGLIFDNQTKTVRSPQYRNYIWGRGIQVATCSQSNGGIWTWGNPEALRAPCKEVPGEHETYGCGFHAVYNFIEALTYLYLAGSVFGFLALVEGTGRVALHEMGWRSEKARVVAVASDQLPEIGLAAINDLRTAADYFDVPILPFLTCDEALALRYTLFKEKSL